MKILHINCNYMDSWLHQTMVENLTLLGVRSSVFAPLYNKENHIVIPEDYVNASVCFNYLDRYVFQHKQKKIINQIKKDYLIDEFSCLHAFTVFTDGNATRKVAKAKNIPYVVAVRNTDVNIFFKYMLHLRSRGIRILKDASAVFFLSESYKNTVINRYVPKKYKSEILKKSYLIPNGIDSFWHKNLYKEKNCVDVIKRMQEKKLKIVYVGTIDKNKNINTTCDAINILNDKGWTIDFKVAGKIKDEELYKKIEERVTYLGVLNKEEIINVYRDTDIFVMPSHTETFGLVYAEAMSQGLPIIYTKGQGFDEQFKEGLVGYAVESNSAEDVATGILKVINNYENMVNNGLNLVSRFRWDHICSQYVSIYEEICSEGETNE